MNLEEAINKAKEEWENNPQLRKDRDEVIAKYGEYFKLENIDNLTAEKIGEFYNLKNNKHWSNLDRPAGWIKKDMPKLKQGLKILLDENISLTERIKKIRDKGKNHVHYFKNSLYTPILLVAYPNKYPVVNAPVLEALDELGLYPKKKWKHGKIEWETVPEVQKIVKDIADQHSLDLWAVDWVWWKIARPEERWDSNIEESKNYSCFILTPNQDSKYEEIQGVQYQYDDLKANSTKLIPGSKFIIQSRGKDSKNYFIGYGKIEKIEQKEGVNEKGRTITKYIATFSNYDKFDEPILLTDEILEEMKSLPEYGNMGPSILPIPRQLYSRITTGDLGEENIENNMNSRTVELLENKKQIIFYGPPGTGKTRAGGELAKEFVSKNKIGFRNFEDVRMNKEIQASNIWEFTDDQYISYVLKKIEDESKKHGFTLTKESDSEHLYILKNENNEIRIGVTFSSSSKQNPNDVYLGVPNKMIEFLSAVPEYNRYQLIINNSVKNFVILPYQIEQRYARFVSGTDSGKWDSTGKGQHAYHITITKDGSELPVRDGTYGETKYDCEKYVRNIKMIFGDFIRNVTFHPSYSYEEFVEGIRPKLNTEVLSYEMENGIFKKICNDARNDVPDNKYILFIDEINRGNISKIFGELITLIENDKREIHYSTLTYTKESFTIPKNLFIIGTMNTADKSLTLLDIALRRRFGFIELMPDKKPIQKTIKIDKETFDLSQLLILLNDKIRVKIGRERQIGHAYFMRYGEPIETPSQLQSIFINEIIPLLQEYLYEDYRELHEILGSGFINKDKEEINDDWKDNLEDFEKALKQIPKDE